MHATRPERPEPELPAQTARANDSGIRARRSAPALTVPAEGSARYRVRELLGRGGMGEVHACEDVRIGREVALKTLRDPREPGEIAAARFAMEARVQGRLEHPAIVPVYDLGTTDDGIPFFTMKRVRGVTLAEVIAGLREGREDVAAQHSLRKLLTAFAQVCLAVDYAHRHGVVHRDLKPQNVMFGSFGEVHVLDWGCASEIAPALDGGCETSAELELDEAVRGGPGSGASGAGASGACASGAGASGAGASGAGASGSGASGAGASGSGASGAGASGRARDAGGIVGTPGYLSPEQARGKRACAKSDVYSLGAVLFEVLTLRPLHDAPTAVARLVATMQGVETRPSRRAPGLAISPALDDLVERALSLDPARRPDARELADSIEGVLDDEARRINRRDWAVRHAAAARDAAARALARRDDDSRALALREAGRALALDPENEQARRALVDLLGCPPEEPPVEARAAMERADGELTRSAMRTMMARVAIWGAFTVFAIVLGVRDWALAALVIGAIVALAGGLAFVQLRGATGRAARLSVIALTALAVAAMGGLFGPFVLVPAFAATSATAYALSCGRAERTWAALLGVASVALPFALELLGVLPPSMTITPDAIALHARLVSFPPLLTALFLVLGNALIVPVNVMVAGRQRDVLDAMRRRLSLHAWQLEKLIPGARG